MGQKRCLAALESVKPYNPIQVSCDVNNRILTTESEPTCCTFGSHNLIYAGTEDGGVIVWNLNDGPQLTETLTILKTSYFILNPSYSTLGLYTLNSHQSSIKSIATLTNKICSIDQFGHVEFWSVIETDKSNYTHDYGSSIGASIKLVRGSTFHIDPLVMFDAN